MKLSNINFNQVGYCTTANVCLSSIKMYLYLTGKHVLVDDSHSVDEQVQRGNVLELLHNPIVADKVQNTVRDRVKEDACDFTILDSLEYQTECDCVRDQGQDEQDGEQIGIHECNRSPQSKCLDNHEDNRDKDQEETEVDQQPGHFVVVEEAGGNLE